MHMNSGQQYIFYLKTFYYSLRTPLPYWYFFPPLLMTNTQLPKAFFLPLWHDTAAIYFNKQCGLAILSAMP